MISRSICQGSVSERDEQVVEYIPTTLQHILDVTRLVRVERIGRVEAVKTVAMNHSIDPQTVSSACTRSLGINMAQFDDLLEIASESEFSVRLVRRFPLNQDYLKRFFAGLSSKSEPEAKIDPN